MIIKEVMAVWSYQWCSWTSFDHPSWANPCEFAKKISAYKNVCVLQSTFAIFTVGNDKKQLFYSGSRVPVCMTYSLHIMPTIISLYSTMEYHCLYIKLYLGTHAM